MKTNLELGDAALIELFRNGDESAFDCLMCRHRSYVREAIRTFVPQEYFMHVDDFLQDTFIKIYKLLRKGENVYEEKGYFRTYAYRMARNICIDYLRKEKRRSKQDADIEEGYAATRTFADWDCEIENPEEILIKKEEARTSSCHRKNLHSLMKLLPADQLEVLLFRTYSEHIPFRDIAVILDRPLNTTLGKHRYALKNLQSLRNLQMSFYRA
jgi:RNA polymerase sigma factor (sigma-70 family)